LNIYYFFILQSNEFSAVQNVLFLFLAAGEEEDSMPPAHPHHRSLVCVLGMPTCEMRRSSSDVSNRLRGGSSAAIAAAREASDFLRLKFA
jgi:hypothetical protein